MLSLLATSVVLLSGCNGLDIPDVISAKSEMVFMLMEPQPGTVSALGAQHLFILAGTSKQVYQGKFVDLPAGVAIGLTTGKLSRFSIREFILFNKTVFPELSTNPDILKAADEQDKFLRKEGIKIPEAGV